MPTFQIQSNFLRGEIDDTLLDRQDEGFYNSAARRIENWFPDVAGSVFIRPAFQNLGGYPSQIVDGLNTYNRRASTLRVMEYAGETLLVLVQVFENVGPNDDRIQFDGFQFLADGTIVQRFGPNYAYADYGAAGLYPTAYTDFAAFVSTAQIGPTMFICSVGFPPARVFRTGPNAYTFDDTVDFYQQLAGAATPTKGTVNWAGTDGLTGEFAATIFQDQLVPGDVVLFGQQTYTVATVPSQIAFTTVETFTGDSIIDTVSRRATMFGETVPFRPARVAAFGGRVLFANTTNKRTALLASAADNPFVIGAGNIRADAPVNAEFLADGLDEIIWMVGASQLFIGSRQGEFVSGQPGQPYTAGNATISKAGSTGSNGVPVVLTQNTLYFLNNLGTQLNAVQFDFDTQAFTTSDISYFAPHLLRNQIIDLTYRPATGYDRTPRIFATDRAGALRAVAVLPAQQTIAWSRISMPSDLEEGSTGFPQPRFGFRAVAASKTRLFAVMTSVYSGSYYIVVLDQSPNPNFLLDLSQPYGPAPDSKLVGLQGLHANIFPAYTGGYYVVSSIQGGLGVVMPDSLGRLDLTVFPGALGNLTVGLPYNSQIQMLPATVTDNARGPRTNRFRRVVRVLVDVVNSTGLFVNNAPIIGNLPQPTGAALPLVSGVFGTRLLGWKRQDSIVLRSSGVSPATIASVSREVS